MNQDATTHQSRPSAGVCLLPKDFSPSINEVIVGRGKKVTNHSGNRRFRELISSEIEDYLLAENKSVKSTIIFRVLKEAKQWSPSTGAFVKLDNKTKRWFSVEEATARNTTAQAFRDANSGGYKSSKKSKQQRRKHSKVIKSPNNAHSVHNLGVSTFRGPGEFGVLPVMSCSYPSLPRQVSLDSTPSSSLEDILDSALEIASPFADMAQQDVPANSRELDLGALWNVLGDQTVTENPFEPTPISSAMVPEPLPSTVMPMLELSPHQSSWKEHTSSVEDGSSFSLQWALSCRRP